MIPSDPGIIFLQSPENLAGDAVGSAPGTAS